MPVFRQSKMSLIRAEVAQIKLLLNLGLNVDDIANIFRVNRTSVSRIGRGDTHKSTPAALRVDLTEKQKTELGQMSNYYTHLLDTN